MEGNPKDFSLRIGQKKDKGEGRKGRGVGRRKEGRKPKKLQCKKESFHQAGVYVACRKRKLSQRKWQSHILILAKMQAIILSAREMMKSEPKKMSS